MRIQQLAEQLFDEINNEVQKAEALNLSRTALDEQGRLLKEKQDRLVRDVAQLMADRKGVEKEKAYIEEQLKLIKSKEALDAVLEAKRQQVKLESEKNEQVIKKIEGRRQELNGLEERAIELHEKEEDLRKSTMENLIRRQRLDDDEADLKRERERLNAIATRLGA